LRSKIIYYLSDSIRDYYKKVLNLSDSPQRVAGGLALGLAFDFLPIPIISIPLSYLVARLVHCNPAATVATVIFFKLAVPFFYTLDYMVGNIILGDLPGPDGFATSIPLLDLFLDKLFEHGYSFLVGCLINATIAYLLVYLTLMFLLKRRRRNPN